MAPSACAVCESLDTKRCGKCNNISFCSVEHQQLLHSHHKLVCKRDWAFPDEFPHPKLSEQELLLYVTEEDVMTDSYLAQVPERLETPKKIIDCIKGFDDPRMTREWQLKLAWQTYNIRWEQYPQPRRNWSSFLVRSRANYRANVSAQTDPFTRYNALNMLGHEALRLRWAAPSTTVAFLHQFYIYSTLLEKYASHHACTPDWAVDIKRQMLLVLNRADLKVKRIREARLEGWEEFAEWETWGLGIHENRVAVIVEQQRIGDMFLEIHAHE